MIQVKPVFQNTYAEMNILKVEARYRIRCLHMVHDGMQGVFRVKIQCEIHFGIDVKMINIEETTLRTVVILTGLMVVSGKVDLTNVEVMDGLLTLIVDVADGELGGDGALFLLQSPLSLQVLQGTAVLAKPAVLIFRTFEAHLIRVIKGECDVPNGYRLDIECHGRFLR